MKGGVRNGSGRPKGALNKVGLGLREAAQQYTQKAIDTLVEIMTDTEATPAVRVSSANSLLDRAYGRPSQSIEVKDNNETFAGHDEFDFSVLTEEELAILRRSRELFDRAREAGKVKKAVVTTH